MGDVFIGLSIFYISKLEKEQNQIKLFMEQRISSPKAPHNHTSMKQLSHRRDFDVRFEEKEDDEIIAESTIMNTHKQIRNTQTFSPDREMLKSKFPLELARENKMKSIADDYYNTAVFQKTNTFLSDIKDVIVSCEEKLRSKRKLVIEQTTTHIKRRWAEMQQYLLELVKQWCKTCQKYEISSFLERSQLKMNGALLQLLSQLATKREEIQVHESKINTLKKQEQILYGEQLTSHMKEVKNYYKYVWNRDYEFQIENLQKECISKLRKSYIYEGLQPKSILQLQQELKTQVDRLIQGFFTLKTTHLDRSYQLSNSSMRQKNTNQHSYREPQPRQSSVYSQKLAERRQQIYYQKLQRDKQWIQLVESLKK